ncbi:hypothetical protein LQ327_09440 [Actinomycetospora endophytica]|uniref:Uncharacterized protein n=1 Tax=Actinomycetospora endophytica TaxID=2291215 RepID=A0ABS8P6E7_9PSEU|nr:hypothetical protein [Actinomycetospora endophytica]MCD2193603.1 hypothetical protein [Actinomycetospora endophytica]
MGTDQAEAMALRCRRLRAQVKDSRALIARAHDLAEDHKRGAHVVRARAEANAERTINNWPAAHGLPSTAGGCTGDDVIGLVRDSARSLFDDCESVSLTLVEQLGDNRRRYLTAASTGTAGALDVAQYRLGEGPCIDAVELDMVAVVEANDLTAAQQRRIWPELARAAERLGMRSALSIAVPWTPWRVGVHPERRSLGAINFYGRQPHAFTQTETHAQLFGCWAGAIMSGAEPADMARLSL